MTSWQETRCRWFGHKVREPADILTMLSLHGAEFKTLDRIIIITCGRCGKELGREMRQRKVARKGQKRAK